MRLIIDIEDEALERLSTVDPNLLYMAIKNGKPYEETTSGDLISHSALTEAEKIICKMYLEDLDKFHTCNEYKLLMNLIDNAPTVGPRIEYGTDGQPYRLFMSSGQVVPDIKDGWRYEESTKMEAFSNNPRWTDKIFVDSEGNMRDFNGNIVGHCDFGGTNNEIR